MKFVSRLIAGAFLALILLAGAYVAVQTGLNNLPADETGRTRLEQSFEKTIGWMEAHIDKLHLATNPILWWMVREAAHHTQHPKLLQIYARYKHQILDKQRKHSESRMFYPDYRPYLYDLDAYRSREDYQLLFLYGLSCDHKLGLSQRIQKQLHADFCQWHFIHTRCVTHQMMGLRFIQRFNCDYSGQVDDLLASLQQTVVTELTWDFRVTDAYIQRVTMLVDTGARERVKPVWIRRILDEQNPDGSWDDFHPVLPLPGGRYLSLTSQLPVVKPVKPSFHATAQALWLMSMLLGDMRH